MQYWRKRSLITSDYEGQAGRNMVKKGSFWKMCDQKGWNGVAGGVKRRKWWGSGRKRRVKRKAAAGSKWRYHVVAGASLPQPTSSNCIPPKRWTFWGGLIKLLTCDAVLKPCSLQTYFRINFSGSVKGLYLILFNSALFCFWSKRSFWLGDIIAARIRPEQQCTR